MVDDMVNLFESRQASLEWLTDEEPELEISSDISQVDEAAITELMNGLNQPY